MDSERFDPSWYEVFLISSATSKTSKSGCAMWVMWSFQLWPSVCHMFVFAHLGRSPRAAALLMEVGSFNPRFFSPCWCDIQTLDPRVPLNTSAVNSEVLLRLIQSRWSTGPSRYSCCSCHTDGISAQGLERFSMDLGANDTSICRGLPPIMVMERRLRRLSYLVGDLHI